MEKKYRIGFRLTERDYKNLNIMFVSSGLSQQEVFETYSKQIIKDGVRKLKETFNTSRGR